MTSPKDTLPTREQLFVIAFAACQNHDVADEVTDEAMSRGVQHGSKLGSDSLPWFRRVINNLVVDRFREPRPVSLDDLAIGQVLVHGSRSPADELIHRELSELTMAAVDRLPAIEREPLVLQFFNGKPMREVSETLGVPISTLEGRCRRGLLKLKGMLRETSIQGVPALVVLGGAAEFSAPGVSASTAADLVRRSVKDGARSAVKASTLPGTVAGLGFLTVLILGASWWAFSQVDAVEKSSGVSRLALAPVDPVDQVDLGTFVPLDQDDTRVDAHIPIEPESPMMTSHGEQSLQPELLLMEDQAAVPTRRFEMQVTVDGAGIEGANVLRPTLKPTVTRRTQSTPVLGIVISQPDENGRIIFDLPEGTGEWLFRITLPESRVALKIFTAATDPSLGAPLDLKLGQVTLLSAGELWADMDMNIENTALVSNIRPGVWVYSMRPYGDPAGDLYGELESDWNFPKVVTGPQYLRKTNHHFDPSLWQMSNPPLTLMVGEEPVTIQVGK